MSLTRSQVVAWVVLGVIVAAVLVAGLRHDVARLGAFVLGAVTTATAAVCRSVAPALMLRVAVWLVGRAPPPGVQNAGLEFKGKPPGGIFEVRLPPKGEGPFLSVGDKEKNYLGNIITNNIPWAFRQLFGISAGKTLEANLQADAAAYLKTNGSTAASGLESELTSKLDTLIPAACDHLPGWLQPEVEACVTAMAPSIVKSVVGWAESALESVLSTPSTEVAALESGKTAVAGSDGSGQAPASDAETNRNT